MRRADEQVTRGAAQDNVGRGAPAAAPPTRERAMTRLTYPLLALLLAGSTQRWWMRVAAASGAHPVPAGGAVAAEAMAAAARIAIIRIASLQKPFGLSFASLQRGCNPRDREAQGLCSGHHARFSLFPKYPRRRRRRCCGAQGVSDRPARVRGR